MPTWRNVAQVLPEPHAAVERMVACVLGHQHCQALAAAGGGQRPGFTVLVTQPESATTTDGSRYSSANIYGFTPALTDAERERAVTAQRAVWVPQTRVGDGLMPWKANLRRQWTLVRREKRLPQRAR
jgi:hypothetical protein